MSTQDTRYQSHIRLLTLGFVLLLTCGSQVLQAMSVTLSPRDDIQSSVNSNPEGTTFVLMPGIYRMQSIRPKNYDIFVGQSGAILNGSRVLSFRHDPKKPGLWVASEKMSNWFHGECSPSHPLCGYTQDLFIDNILQTPASTLEGLKSGTWYADRTQGEIYIPTDPQKHTIEISEVSTAFNALSSIGVHISHLTIEKYASGAQQGAIGGARTGQGWVVDDVEVRWNHGAGIELGSNSQVLNSYIHHNGQLGICFVGANQKALNNEISWNNYAGYDTGWEAGGGKFLLTTNLLVKSNYVHDNIGTGLWTDTDAVNTTYESNVVANNYNQGIQHEASYSATIRKNAVFGNGNHQTTWLWNAQILLQSSPDVEVYENSVEVPAEGGNGIVLINEIRSGGAFGQLSASRDRVHDNTITYSSNRGYSGIVNNVGAYPDSAVGNNFNSNHYKLLIGDGGQYHWQWFGPKTWSGIQSQGQENLGTCCK